MELKKIGLFSVIGMLAMASLTFSACSDDDDDNSTNSGISKDSLDKLTKQQGVTVSGVSGKYTYVDLGLKSGTKWATYNVGASNPWRYGDYFAWGETSGKDVYDNTTYRWGSGNYSFYKYVTNDLYGEIDNITTLEAGDDAATKNWGIDWRMPTKIELQELLDGCTWEWTDDFNGSGKAGRIGTSNANGNTIFLPAAGSRYKEGTNFKGKQCYYWSSSLNDEPDLGTTSVNSGFAYGIISFGANSFEMYTSTRFNGWSVRAVVK